MFSFTLDIYCTSVRPGRGIPHMWLSLRFLLSFYLLKGFFSSFSWLLLRVKGRGCHTLLKPYETSCGLWIWAIQIKFDWLIDTCDSQFVCEDGQRRADRHSHTFTHAPADRSSSCRLRRNAVFELLCCRISHAPFIQEHKYEFSRFL